MISCSHAGRLVDGVHDGVPRCMRGLIAHYDGHSWQGVTHQPIGAPYLRKFVAVHGTSSGDVWAVGQQLGQGGSTALIYHHAP